MRLRPLLLLILVGALTSCGDGIAARVGGDYVTDADLAAELDAIAANERYVAHVELGAGRSIRASEAGLTRGFIAGVLTRAIHHRVLEQVARAQGVAPTDRHHAAGRREAAGEVGGDAILDSFGTEQQARLVERSTLLVAMRAHTVSGMTPERHYRSNRAAFTKSCTRHLVVSTRQQALDARDRIADGESFAAVAQDVSIDTGTARRGGDLGCNGAGDLVTELDRAAFAQPVGAVGPLIATSGRWQLLIVESRETPPLRQIRGEVAVALQRYADAQVGATLVDRFADVDVAVSKRYGSWSKDARKVVV